MLITYNDSHHEILNVSIVIIFVKRNRADFRVLSLYFFLKYAVRFILETFSYSRGQVKAKILFFKIFKLSAMFACRLNNINIVAKILFKL